MASRRCSSLNYYYLTYRRYSVEQALDELTVLEKSGRLEDLFALTEVLDSYPFSRFPNTVRSKVYRIDGFMLLAKATCLDMEEKECVTTSEVNRTRGYLEQALDIITPLF